MDITIFTPLSLEKQAVIAHLMSLTEQVVDGQVLYKGVFQGLHELFYITVVVTGSKNAPTAHVVEKTLAHTPTQLAFLVGVAGGVKDVKIGDVVVGTKVYGYESGKERADCFLVRPEVYPASKDLVTAAELVEHQAQWPQRIKISPIEYLPKVIFGPIASGDKVITTTQSDLYQRLKSSYNDTIALEMEAFGFGQTFHAHQNIRWLNVRGISDLLDGKNAKADANHQPLAAAVAAAFVFEMLYQFNPSTFNLPIMNTKDLSKAIFQLLFPLSPLGAIQDFSQATHPPIKELWKKVILLFIEELEDLKSDLSDTDIQAAIRAFNQNSTFKRRNQTAYSKSLKTGKRTTQYNHFS